MPAIVEFPQVVNEAARDFADLFANEPQRRHFAEYLTGLMVAHKKTVAGINAQFAETTDSSCLNRFLTEVDWDVEQLNERRLALLQNDPPTRYHDQGVIAIDDVLIDHDGKFIEDVGWFWDHAEDRHKIAHDYLFSNYVCPSGKHYPLEFRRFKKREQCEATGAPFEDHGVLFRQLIDWVCDREIPGDFTFDSYFTNAANLNHIHAKQDRFGQPRAYIGDLKFNRKISFRGRELKAEEFAATIGRADRKELRRFRMPVKSASSRQGGRPPFRATAPGQVPSAASLVSIGLLLLDTRDRSSLASSDLTPRRVPLLKLRLAKIKFARTTKSLQILRHGLGADELHLWEPSHIGKDGRHMLPVVADPVERQ